MPWLGDLLGESPGIVALREKIRRLLESRPDGSRLPTILIEGETGTGKGLLAHALHRASKRGSGPFVDVNCAAIPESLLEAELFGFERGAFTDARHPKPGLFETAHRGTIFLDEIGLIPDAIQAKLLKVLEERIVRRLGSTRSERVDVWILAATNTDLTAATRARRFREDLYHRLSVVTLRLPPLRERGRDILVLAEHFLARACADYQLSPRTLAADARARLRGHAWPGNVRELSNVIERVALVSDAPEISAEMLELGQAPASGPDVFRPAAGGSLKERVDQLDREQVLEALRATDWNIARAAARLGIPRGTLRYRLAKHRFDPHRWPVASKRSGRSPVSVPGERHLEPAAPDTVQWERRRLTVLRATLRIDSETATGIGRMLDAIVEKVQVFGGRVEERSLTGVLAAFGVEPVEDAASRAILAAMATCNTIERARREVPTRPTVKLGIHTGDFMVNRFSAAAELDLDEKHRAAATLESLLETARPGTVMVSTAAAPFVERRFELIPAEAADGTAHGYRLAASDRATVGRSARMVKLVGRQHDLALLRSRLTLAQRGHGHAVAVAGEPGIGKSRLLYEFRESIAGEPVTYLESQGHSYGQNIPYLPVLEMLRASCRIGETDSAESTAEKVRASLTELEIDTEEALPYVLHLLGVPKGTDALAGLSPEGVATRTLEILLQMSARGSRRRPLVLAVDDLHWIDKASEAFFTRLVEQLPGASILLLVTYRSGYRPGWLERSYATQTALQPLGPADSLSVIQSIPGATRIQEALARHIVGKAEGNPFFLEELAWAVLDKADVGEPIVPDTVQEVLSARIERLPEDSKCVLRTAAVLGREFPVRLLGAISDGPGDPEPHLRELTRLEFLSEKPGAEERTYIFKHGLTHDVAYESLPLARRQALHAAAGRALETFHAGRLETVWDRLAHHYARTEHADTAVLYLTRVAEQAARADARAEAAAALEQALAHVPRLPAEDQDRWLVDLTLRLAFSLSLLGRFGKVRKLLVPLQDRVERLGSPALAGPFYFRLGLTHSYFGDQEPAAVCARRALEEAERCHDDATAGKTHYLLALRGSWVGELRQGLQHGRQAVALLERSDEPHWLGLSHFVVGVNHAHLGEFDAALEAGAHAESIGRATGDPRLQTVGGWIAGWVRAIRGEFAAAIEACNRSVDGARDPIVGAISVGNLGRAYLEAGQVGRAVSALERSVEQLAGLPLRYLQARTLGWLSDAVLAQGNAGRARELATEALTMSEEAGYWDGINVAARVAGRIACAAGHLADAESYLSRALAVVESAGARFEAGRTRLACAELSNVLGDRDGAIAHLGDAHRLFAVSGAPPYVERAAERARSVGTTLD